MARNRWEEQAVYRQATAVAKRFLHFRLADGGYALQYRRVKLAGRGSEPLVLGYPCCPSSVCLAALTARWVRVGASAL